MISTLNPSSTRINVSKDFTDVPGPRAKDEGPFSGEQFLEELLLPKFQEALATRSELYIDLDGTEGYATSFLESAFGGLTRRFDPATVLRVIRFKSEEEPYLIEEIKSYISEANAK